MMASHRLFSPGVLLRVLVVLALMLVLVSPFLAGRPQRGVHAIRSRTRSMLEQAVIIGARARWGDADPGSHLRVNETNRAFSGMLVAEWPNLVALFRRDGWMRDVDGDEVDELIDPWGHPIIVVHKRQVGVVLPYSSPVGVVQLGDAAGSASISRQLRTFGFCIWSIGPDGLNNYGEGDDVAPTPGVGFLQPLPEKSREVPGHSGHVNRIDKPQDRPTDDEAASDEPEHSTDSVRGQDTQSPKRIDSK